MAIGLDVTCPYIRKESCDFCLLVIAGDTAKDSLANLILDARAASLEALFTTVIIKRRFNAFYLLLPICKITE